MAWTYTGGLQSPSIYSDGTYVYIGGTSTSPANYRYIAKYNYNGTGFSYVASSSSASTQGGGAGIYIGAADWGAGNRYLISNYNSGAMQVFRGYDLMGAGVHDTNDTTKTFNNANGEQMTGIIWDGTQFRRINAYGKVYKHSTSLATTGTRAVTYAWYDSDTNPTTDPITAAIGTHRTKASPAYNFTFERRGWVKVTVPPIPDNGNNNDPDSAIIYIDDWKQADLSPGVRTVLYGTFATSGTHSLTTSEFAGFASNPGSIVSAAKNLTTLEPIIQLYGDGSGRVGPYQWDITGELPAASISKNSAQSANTTSTMVAFNSTRKLTGGCTLSANGLIQVPYDGWYQVSGNVTFASSTSSARRIVGVGYNSDGSATTFTSVSGTILASAQDTANITALATSAVVYLTANQYVGIWVNASTSYSLDVSTGYMNNISVAYLGWA
jgi:hypothetical protein